MKNERPHNSLKVSFYSSLQSSTKPEKAQFVFGQVDWLANLWSLFLDSCKYLTCAHHFSRFVSTIVQFQLHEALCIAAGQYDPNDPRKPMHRCSIYNDQTAGALLK